MSLTIRFEELRFCRKHRYGMISNVTVKMCVVTFLKNNVLIFEHQAKILYSSLVFRVYYERPMVIDSLNLKLRQIVRFSSNMILNEMSSAFLKIFFFFSLIAQHEERPLYHFTCGNFSFYRLVRQFASTAVYRAYRIRKSRGTKETKLYNQEDESLKL